MKNLGVAIVIGLWAASLPAQGTPPASPTAQKSLAATIGVYVFPTQGETAEQQAKDQAACYLWAVENTGTDPFELAKQLERQAEESEAAQAKAQQAAKGAGAKGAVGGAAVGAVVGGIASDDAGKGAGRGAAVGLLRARRQARAAQAKAAEEATRQAEQVKQASSQEIEAFKKSFGVCLEAEHYLVRF